MKKTLRNIIIAMAGVMLSLCLATTANAGGLLPVTYTASQSCRLTSAQTVSFSATLTVVPPTDNGLIYLYQLQPYEYAATATDPVIGSAPISMNPSFNFSLYDAAGQSRICKKFALCIYSGGVLTTIGNAQYITNPEIAATHTRPLQNIGFVEPYEKMVLERVDETNVLAVAIDNYSTAVIVNKANKTLINPAANRRDAHPVPRKFYYMFNAATADGVNTLQNTMSSFALATHVDEFIIGNEVNNRQWNYTASMDWEQYIWEYVQAFRVSYNAIKSTNANAKVYISLDQVWNMDNPVGSYSYYEYIDAMDFLLYFNSFICAEGNINWGLAFHPYLYPMTYSKFWDPSGVGSLYATRVAAGQIVTFQNLPVMTNFMALPGMRNPQGGVRSIILPEIGITSAQGYEVQAATYQACYTACRNNPFIERIYFHRMNEGGLCNFGTAGISESVYQSISNPATALTYDQWAKNYIGITDWHQVVQY